MPKGQACGPRIIQRLLARGLDPINAVLAGVPFRRGSRLAIEPTDHPNNNLGEFRKVVLAFTRDNPLGVDLFNDEAQWMAGSGEYAVPLGPPSAAAITDRAGEVSAWLTRWRPWFAQRPDVSLRTRTVHTKFGDQPACTHLDIPGISALASLLLAAVNWFRAHPRSGLTVRSVPVPGMHIKWLARHRSMLLACLGTATGFGRAGLYIRPEAVLIVENKEPALAWSDTTGLAITRSPGNHLDVLARLPWLRHVRWASKKTSTGTTSQPQR